MTRTPSTPLPDGTAVRFSDRATRLEGRVSLVYLRTGGSCSGPT